MIDFDATLVEALESCRSASSAQLKIQRYLSMLQPQPGEHILDIGCGGWLTRLIAPLVGPAGHVVAIARERAAIELAQSRSAAIPPGVLRYECANASALPFASDAFDAAVCVSMLGFCDQPAQVLAEIRRVLRPGGRLLVANSDEDTRIYNTRDRERGRRIEHALADRTRHPWMGRCLAHLLTQAGFRCVREDVACDVEHSFAPGQAGYTLAHALRGYLLRRSGIEVHEYEQWLSELREADWDGAYAYAVTTFAYLVTSNRSRPPNRLHEPFASIEEMLSIEAMSTLEGRTVSRVEVEQWNLGKPLAAISECEFLSVGTRASGESHSYCVKRTQYATDLIRRLSTTMNVANACSGVVACLTVYHRSSRARCSLMPVMATATAGRCSCAIFPRNCKSSNAGRPAPGMFSTGARFARLLMRSRPCARFYRAKVLDDAELNLCAGYQMYAYLRPELLAAQAVQYPQFVDVQATGWSLLDRLESNDVAAALGALHVDPTPLVNALAHYPVTLVHGDPKRENLGLVTVQLRAWPSSTDS